jgi:hypothetical protein
MTPPPTPLPPEAARKILATFRDGDPNALATLGQIDELLDQPGVIAAFRECATEISDEQARNAVRLRIQEARTMKEVISALGVDPATARRLVQRGMTEVQQALIRRAEEALRQD